MPTTEPNTDQPRGTVQELPEPTYQSLKDLHAYWLAKKGGDIAPPRSAIHPEEIVELLPTIGLMDVVGEAPRLRFRLFGTELVKAYGQELTGKFAENIDLDAVGPDILSQLTSAVLQCCPKVARIQFTKSLDGRFVQYERIALPLSDDGKTVNMLLLGYVPEKAY